MALLRSPYARSGLAVLVMPALAAGWKLVLLPLPIVALTLGRAAILIAGALLVVDLARQRAVCPAIGARTLGFVGALVALGAWISFSAVFLGCGCASEVAGYVELAAVGILATTIASLDPRLRPLLAWGGAAAGLVAAALALAGLGPLSEGTRNLATYQGRLAGTFGNSNFLGYAIAFSPAVLLALTTGRSRLVRFLLLLAAGATLLAVTLTFSRGALVAAAAGLLTALTLVVRRSSARMALLAAGLATFVAVAVVAYPVFRSARQEATSPRESTELEALAAADKSGWQANRQGLIPNGPASLRNGAGELVVVTTASGEGVSRGWGVARLNGDYRLRFQARGGKGQGAVSFGLEDAERGNGQSSKREPLLRRWRAYTVRWSPSAESPKARLYIWQGGNRSSFSIRDVTVEDLATSTVFRPSLSLLGPELKEARDLSVRLAGAELAIKALSEQPLIGIGWGSFPGYAAREGPYGQIPTHNEYLRVAAELGAVGLVLLALVGASLVPGLRELGRRPSGPAEGAALATGIVGLLFLNGLVSPASLPLMVAGAALATSQGKPRTAQDRGSAGYEGPMDPHPKSRDLESETTSS